MDSFTPEENSSISMGGSGSNYMNQSCDSGRPIDLETEKTSMTAEEQESHNQPEEQTEPIVSILNLVVDFVMKEPSPLEPDEFRWKIMNNRSKLCGDQDCTEAQDEILTERIQVPVLRIFGPIVRGPGMFSSCIEKEPQGLDSRDVDGLTGDVGDDHEMPPNHKDEIKGIRNNDVAPQGDDNSAHEKLHQSGCVHIHGAYPYMIARPVEAGPDSSNAFFRAYYENAQGTSAFKRQEKGCDVAAENLSNSSSEDETCMIDWDDGDSVAMITDEIHCRLEQALQCFMEQDLIQASKRDSQQNSDLAPTSTTRLIRQITVVHGRGFYTYCNGGVAPFLRIEYYDPSHRWRIKIMLERGLELPEEYLPRHNPDEDRNCNMNTGTKTSSNVERTTVQFPNEGENEERGRLGLGLLRFRCYEAHTPYTMQFFKDYNLSGMSWIHIGDCRFRTPLPNILKDRLGGKSSTAKRHEMEQDKLTKDPFGLTKTIVPRELCWTEKYSSQSLPTCHPEVTLNQSIMNIAGPEFWTRRDTSCDIELDTTVTNILNVKDIMVENPNDPEVHWRAVPSLREMWIEERKRMAELVPPRENFLSNDSQSEQFNQHDDMKKRDLQFTLSVRKGADRPGSLLALIGSRQLFESSPGLKDDFDRAIHDIISKHEKNLNNVKEMMNIPKSRRGKRNLTVTTKISNNKFVDIKESSALQSLLEQFTTIQTDTLANQLQHTQLLSPVDCNNLSQSLGLPSKLTKGHMKEVDDDLEFFRKIHREVVDDELIDPLTLTPYEGDCKDDYWAEEDNMNEEDFEHSLTLLATQHQGTTCGIQGIHDADANLDKPILASVHVNNIPLDIEVGNQDKKTKCMDGAVNGNNLTSYDIETRQQFNINVGTGQHRKGNSIIRYDDPPALGRCMWQPKKTPPLKGNFFSSLSSQNQERRAWYPIAHYPATSVSWLGYANLHNIARPSIHLGDRYEPLARTPSVSEVSRWLRKRKVDQVEDPRVVKAALNLRGRSVATKRKCNVAHHLHGEWDEGNLNQEPGTNLVTSRKTDDCSAVIMTSNAEQSPAKHHESSNFSNMKSRGPTDHLSSADTAEYSNLNNRDTDISHRGSILHYKAGLKSSTTIHYQQELEVVQKRQVTIMSIEVHVQCRTGKAGTHDSRDISMQADPSRDAVYAVCYGYAVDPGGGEKIKVIDRGCIFVPTQKEMSSQNQFSAVNSCSSDIVSLIGKTLGCSKTLIIETVRDERHLLLRVASLVRWKDPDVLTSWDTQDKGIGYLIQRGLFLGNGDGNTEKGLIIDMVRLLGRTPRDEKCDLRNFRPDETFNEREERTSEDPKRWGGSILGAEWDDRVGAGAGPSSIVGRLVLNCWRIMSEELNHPNASYQPAIVWTVLKKRIPFHDDLMLTNWYGGTKGALRWKVLKYRLCQALANILLLDAMDVIGRAGEAARLSGVELSQSFPGIRGSQYKVEGVLLRALKSLNSDERGKKRGKQASRTGFGTYSDTPSSQTESPWKQRRNSTTFDETDACDRRNQREYYFFSPSKSDVRNQEALECQAMTLEPQSGFHFDPIVVCDFTALYPSLIIAYNLCYSTIAGKLEYHSTRKEMNWQGRTTGKVGPYNYTEAQTAFVLKEHMKSNEKYISRNRNDRAYCLPSGSIFVSEQVVKGVLPSVLDEILATRAMLKKAMIKYKSLEKPPAAVLRQLEARQLALKYVANVIYGYTSATFSGRCAMPLLADTIVDCGRRTLTRAITLATEWGKEVNGRWTGATVVYGDTDSIFVKLPGRSVQEAFVFGDQFCDAVTASNPPPIQLKLEKVYMGTLLQTKKRYCGMKYDRPDQYVPMFEAKGIETVRKDQCPITQKILRNSLITIFQERNLSKLNQYLVRQWALIHSGSLPVSDFILTGRLRSSYRGKVGPVQAALMKRLTEADPGKTIRHKERLPYVIVASPGRSFKLRDCVLTPNELLTQWDAYSVHSFYYTTKHVNAALDRCFSLEPFRIDINIWYQSAPKPHKRIHHWPVSKYGNSTMISMFFGSDVCALCGQQSKSNSVAKSVVCYTCKADPVSASFLALNRLNHVQQRANILALICERCNGFVENSGTYAPQRFRENQKFEKSSILKPQLKSHGVISPIANCTCIDCPVSYQRHELRESEIEALSLCRSLNLEEK